MNQKGIWEHENLLYPSIKTENRFTLHEGATILEENHALAQILGLETIYLKREDRNPTGSHKDRGLAFQISAHIQDGEKEFVISSSGNSAISAINLLKNTKYILHIFLSSKLSIVKIDRLLKSLDKKVSSEIFKGKDTEFENFRFYFSPRPLSSSFKFSQETGIKSLRGSTDIYGYEGFKTIAHEILVDTDSVFIPTSSGTTAKGIHEGFKQKDLKIPLHIVQTTKINTLVHRFDKDYEPSINSCADSIVDRIGHRAKDIEEIITETKGTGWIVSDKEIEKAQHILKDQDIYTSNESAMTIAAIKKAKSHGWEIKKPICIFTGTT